MLHILGMIQQQLATGVPSPEYAEAFLANFGKALGAALTVIGAGMGIGWIGSRMTENMARQPEIAPNIQTASIILAALIEGAALFALVIAFLI
jgi:F-type H+-transporting ATPase subunit c